MSEIPAERVDPVKMSLLYQNCTEKVQYFCYRLLGNEAEATDVTMEALIKTALHPSDYENHRACAQYYTVARNLCIDRIRRRKHLSPSNISDLAETLETDSYSFDRAVWNALYARSLSRCFEHLSNEERDCLLICYVEGFTLEESAEIVGITKNQVRYRIQTALKKLEACLRKEGLQA